MPCCCSTRLPATRVALSSALRRLTDLRVIFTTGHVGLTIDGRSADIMQVERINKPYQLAELARKVSGTLTLPAT